MRHLVFVPGLGLGPESCHPTLGSLGVVGSSVVTLRGYGEPARGRDLRPETLAEQLLDRLHREGTPSPVVLAGHSASCQVVVETARATPGIVAALVLVGPTTDPAAASWPRLAYRWLRTARHEDPRQVPALVRQYARTGLGSMLRVMNAARRHRIDEALAGCGCPVLVLRGRHDRICPPAWADRLTGAHPQLRAESLPAGGHMVPLTHGSLVAAAIRRFLTEDARFAPQP
jgi:pimeloyl-ACP methyl ester carboxylesterase